MSRLDTVTVLGGGWSAKAFLDRLPGFVIGVNDAGLLAPANLIVSMDRLWAEGREEQLLQRQVPTWLRKVPAALGALSPGWLGTFSCDHTSTRFSDQVGVLNGTHSGFCALNKAYQMRPRRLVMVGFDMAKGPNGEAHWFPDYPWAKPGGATSGGKFKEWARQFETVAGQLKAAGIAVEVWGETAIPAFGRARAAAEAVV